MSVTGPARPNLTAQLQEKLSQERKEIEALTTAELKQLAASLNKSSKAVLDDMETHMNARLDDMRRQLSHIETRQKRWPLWTALSSAVIVLAVFALLWMATTWAQSDLRTVLNERFEARQALTELQEQTHGISFLNADEGTFLVLPDSAQKTWWTCDNAACVKLSE